MTLEIIPSRTSALALPVLLLLVPSLALAQPAPPPPAREGTAEFAFVGTTGNASTQTIGLSGSYIVRPDGWVVINRASFVRNEAEDIVTANAFQYLFRTERTLSPRLAVFGEYAYFRDIFAGVEHRNALVGGLTVKVVESARQLFFVDAGLGYLNEQRLVPPDVSSATYSLGGGYKARLSDTAEFTDDLRLTGTFAEAGDWRVAHTAAVAARLTSVLSLKVSHAIRYANRPVEGFEKTDTTTSVALVAKF